MFLSKCQTFTKYAKIQLVNKEEQTFIASNVIIYPCD